MSRFGFRASSRRDRVYPKRFHRNVYASWSQMTEPIQPRIRYSETANPVDKGFLSRPKKSIHIAGSC